MSRRYGSQAGRAQYVRAGQHRSAAKVDARTLALQYQNTVNRAQGEHFERLLNAACDYYRKLGVADIEKTPEPLQPVADKGGGLFLARYTKKGQNDYKGCVRGGRAIYIEAKYTDTGRMLQERVTANQTDRMERAYNMGAISCILCSFGAVGFYRIPWTVWRDLKAVYGHKYITPREAAPFEIRIGGPGVLLFLEGIEKEAQT